MPTVQGTDLFDHNDFTVPGGGPYRAVEGTPVRDLAVVRTGDPASLLIEATAAAENVQHDISGSPTFGWHGFYFRQNAADEIGNVLICKLFAAAGAAGEIGYLPATNRLYHHIAGTATFPDITISTDVYIWIEQIFDVSATTRRLRTRVGGVDLSAEDLAGSSISHVTHHGVGNMSADSTKCRFSRVMWGTATSLTDWHGEPPAPTERAYKRLTGPRALTTSSAILYTSPVGVRTTIRRIFVNNPSGSPVDFTLAIGSDAASTRLFDAKDVPAGGEIDLNGDYTLEPTEFVTAFAGTSSTLVVVIDGYQEAIGVGP